MEKTVNSALIARKSSMHISGDITKEQNSAINRLINQTNNDLYRGKFTRGRHRISDDAIKHIISGKLLDFESVGTVHSLKGRMKKGSTAAINSAQGLSEDSLPFVTSNISIAQLLDFVNSVQQSILSDDVLNHFNETRKPEGIYYGQVLHSDRDTNTISNRTLLANFIESVSRNEAERKKLQKYKIKIALLDQAQNRATRIRNAIRQIDETKSENAKIKLQNYREALKQIGAEKSI